jgi:protocatechuate 3,4-dioxygenase beta subunit
LLVFDPIYNAVPAGARERLHAAFDMESTRPEWALAYKFDIVLRGRNATPLEN